MLFEMLLAFDIASSKTSLSYPLAFLFLLADLFFSAFCQMFRMFVFFSILRSLSVSCIPSLTLNTFPA